MAFFGLANGNEHDELLLFFDGIFKLLSTIYKRRTLRSARRIPNTKVGQSFLSGNLPHKFLLRVYFSWRPVDSHQTSFGYNFAKNQSFSIDFLLMKDSNEIMFLNRPKHRLGDPNTVRYLSDFVSSFHLLY